MNKTLTNLISFQIGWFACVVGAGQGRPSLGPLVVAALVALHLFRHPHPAREAGFLATVAVAGTAIDSLIGASGILSYRGAYAGWIAPVWISALWMNFATTVHVSLKWLVGRLALAGILGAVAGPLAYYAGARLGAIDLHQPGLSVVVLAVVWGLFLPAVFWRRKKDTSSK